MKFLLVLSLALLAPLHARAQAAAPDPDQLLRGVRQSATLQDFGMAGVIRKKSAKTPISIAVYDDNIQFDLKNGEIIHLPFGDEQADPKLLDNKGKDLPFPATKLVQPIAGSDVTYEDLSLRFLYWRNAKFEPEDKAGHWKIRVNNPGKKGAFAAVYIWVDKSNGALSLIKAYDPNGLPLKQFEVTEIRQIPGGKGYTAQTMKVSSLYRDAKGGERIKSETYLDFEEPKKRPDAGPRR